MLHYYIIALSVLNWKTLTFNFHYFPFRTAIKLPVFVAQKVRLQNLGGSIKLGKHIRPGIVKIGYGKEETRDERKSRTIWDVQGEVIFHGKADINHGSKVHVTKSGKVQFGDNLWIQAESTIKCNHSISVGKNCLLSWDILMMDSDFHSIYNSAKERINDDKPIVVGDNVWIGCRTTILKGASIAPNSVVAACSLVTKSLSKSNSIYGGNSSEPIKNNITWEKD